MLTNSPQRAIGHTRVSTDEQAEKGYSLPEQEGKIRAYTDIRGYDLLTIIPDDFTGKLLDRPGLLQITRLAEARAFEVLVCVKIDRLARKNNLRRNYEDHLAAYGVRVEYAEQHFEENPSGRFQKGVMGEFAEFEWEIIRERTMKGRRQKAEQQHVMPVGRYPFGYRMITKAEAAILPGSAGRAGEYVIVEEEAGVVREVFRLCAAGTSLRGIAREMLARGCPSGKGGAWTQTRVRLMLTNSAYAGRAYYGKQKSEMTSRLTRGGKPAARVTDQPRETWVEIPCPAIVTEELWQRCQERIRENAEFLRGRPSEDWLLHGTIRCGHCETLHGFARSMHGRKIQRATKVDRYYACSSKVYLTANGTMYCGTQIRAETIETMALDALRRIAEPGRLAEEIAARLEGRRREVADPLAERADLERRMLALDAEETEKANLLLRGVSERVVMPMLADIHARRKMAEERLAALAPLLQEVANPERVVADAERAAAMLRRTLPAAEGDPRILRRLFHAFLRIRVYPDRKPEIKVDLKPDIGETG